MLASAASWEPAVQDLRPCLADRLSMDHPWLAAPAAGSGVKTTQIGSLLDRGLIMPILDGLDEIPAAARGLAIAKINDAIRPGERLVVTSRTAQWEQAVRPPGGIQVRLRAAAGISLCALDTGAVAAYLRADAGGLAAAARWDPIVAAMHIQPTLRQVLSCPLMAGLARVIYNPRPGENPAAVPDPAELCGNPAAAAHLFDAYIPAVYRHPAAQRWTARQAETWLVFLARHLEHTTGGPDFAWWQLRRGMPYAALAGVTVAVSAIMVTFAFMSTDQLALGRHGNSGFLLTLWATVFTRGLIVRTCRLEPSPRLRVRASSPARMLLAGTLGGTAAGIWAGILAGPRTGLLLAIWYCLGYGTTFIQDAPDDLTVVVSPRAVLARDRRVALLLLAGPVLVSGLICGLLFSRQPGLAAGLRAGALVGLLAGATWSAGATACPSYLLARAWLAMRRQLPWSLMSFLADAHQRGVLRQSGAVYQFRHLGLQHRLATRAGRRGRTAR